MSGNLFGPSLFQKLNKIILKLSTCGLVFGHYLLSTQKQIHILVQSLLCGAN